MEIIKPFDSDKNRQILDFKKSNNLEDLDYKFFKVCKSFNIEKFSLITHPCNFSKSIKPNAFSTYPAAWVKRYIQKDYHLLDPLFSLIKEK